MARKAEDEKAFRGSNRREARVAAAVRARLGRYRRHRSPDSVSSRRSVTDNLRRSGADLARPPDCPHGRRAGSRTASGSTAITIRSSRSEGSILSPAPVYLEFEEASLADYLALALEGLGPDDEVMKAALEGRTPAEAAAALVRGTKLGDPAVRKSLLDGGLPAVTASTDPLIVLYSRIDPILRQDITRTRRRSRRRSARPASSWARPASRR